MEDPVAPGRGSSLPYWRALDFLPEAEREALLSWTLAHRNSFKPARVSSLKQGGPDEVDPARRIALTCRDLGSIESMLRVRMLERIPELLNRTGTGGPPPTMLELELAAHGNGAHFRRHVDLPIGKPWRMAISENKLEGDRVLSAVYYFHREPRRFSGGELRLHPLESFGAGAEVDCGNHIDLDPLSNSFVVFPSWVPHEVRTVTVSSGDFVDHRFALNCWFRRHLG
jgi:SM-20-related protein